MIEKKNMYIVIKQDDAKKYLSQEEKHELINILGKISNGRMNDNKHLRHCLIFQLILLIS